MGNSRKLIQLSTQDNVAVACQALQQGEILDFNEEEFLIEKAVTLGHKIALKDIALGEKILKYGIAIGSATQAIKKGEQVHIHNMKSDFIPTYIID